MKMTNVLTNLLSLENEQENRKKELTECKNLQKEQDLNMCSQMHLPKLFLNRLC